MKLTTGVCSEGSRVKISNNEVEDVAMVHIIVFINYGTRKEIATKQYSPEFLQNMFQIMIMLLQALILPIQEKQLY